MSAEKTVPKTTVIINEHAYHFDKNTLCPDDFRKAVGADSDYEVWQVVGRPDPEGQLPRDDVQVKDCIEVKNGTRFKVVPPGTFGAPDGAPSLEADVEDLRARGHAAEVVADSAGRAVLLKGFPLPPGYTQASTDLLVRIPQAYPHAHPDMFYVEVGVLLSGGKVPRSAEHVEGHVGRQWRRFSWHLNNRWHPGRDGLLTFIAFIEARLAKKE